MTAEKIILPKGQTIRIKCGAVSDTYYYDINKDTQIVIDKYTEDYINVQIEISSGVRCSIWGIDYEIRKDGK